MNFSFKMSGFSENVTIVPNNTIGYMNSSNVGLKDFCQWQLPALEWLKVVMLTFGFFGNGATTFIIIVKKDLHNITFATICAIALSDFFYCFCGVLWGFFYYAYMDPNDFRVLQACVSEFFNKYLKTFLAFMITSAYTSCGLFIAVLSILRYIIIVHPFRSHTILTKKVIIVTFVSVYGVSIVYAILQSTKVIENSKISRPIDTVLSYLIPLIVMIVFHTLKLSKLKKSKFQNTRKKARKMELVVILVVMSYLLLLLPWHIVSIGYEFGILKPSYSVVTASALLLQLNNCINPVFYAFLSPLVRKNLCFCFRRKKEPLSTTIKLRSSSRLTRTIEKRQSPSLIQ